MYKTFFNKVKIIQMCKLMQKENTIMLLQKEGMCERTWNAYSHYMS